MNGILTGAHHGLGLRPWDDDRYPLTSLIPPSEGLTLGSAEHPWGAVFTTVMSASSVIASAVVAAPVGTFTEVNLDQVNVATGANKSMGTATLVAGTVPVATGAVDSASIIFLSRNSLIGTPGHLDVGTIVDGTSFVIDSSEAGDVSTVNWWIINPN